MKSYFLVSNGAATAIECEELNGYPFVAAYHPQNESETFSEDWHLYESTGTEWCVAYAESDAEAVTMADAGHHGLTAKNDLWCAIRHTVYPTS